jgi:hypothetical protein
MRPDGGHGSASVRTHEFVKQPLPFPGAASHICLKPVDNTGDAAAWPLIIINAPRRNPNEDVAAVPSGLYDRLRDNDT